MLATCPARIPSARRPLPPWTWATELSLPYLPILEAVGRYLVGPDLVEVKQRLGPLAVDLGRLFPQLETASAAETQDDAQELKLRLFASLVAVPWVHRGGVYNATPYYFIRADTIRADVTS